MNPESVMETNQRPETPRRKTAAGGASPRRPLSPPVGGGRAPQEKAESGKLKAEILREDVELMARARAYVANLPLLKVLARRQARVDVARKACYAAKDWEGYKPQLRRGMNLSEAREALVRGVPLAWGTGPVILMGGKAEIGKAESRNKTGAPLSSSSPFQLSAFPISAFEDGGAR